MSEILLGIFGLVILLMLFLTGIQLSFAMTIVGFAGYAYLKTFNAGLYLVAKDFYDVFTRYGFTVLPLFILMGQLGLIQALRRNCLELPGNL